MLLAIVLKLLLTEHFYREIIKERNNKFIKSILIGVSILIKIDFVIFVSSLKTYGERRYTYSG